MKDKDKKIKAPEISPPCGDVFDTGDMVNKYGTYNIQPTADTENFFPEISQGLPGSGVKQTARKNRDKKAGG